MGIVVDPSDEGAREKRFVTDSARAHRESGDPMTEELNPRHQLILAGLEDANAEHGRVISVGELLAELTEKETELLREAYAGDLSSSVGRVLRQFVDKGVVVTPGKLGGVRYYGTTRVLGSEGLELPPCVSRRRRSLAFIERLARDKGRALRMTNIREAVEESDMDLDPDLVARDVSNLTRTGEMLVVGQVRGDGGGRNLYLPASLASVKDAYLVDRPETWLEQVVAAFRKVWARRQGDAEWCGSSPLAVPTGEVRDQVRADHPQHPRLDDPQLLVNALQQLARGSDPALRKISRPDHRSVLWVPAGLEDDEFRVDDAYAHDTERVAEAVRRAEGRRNVPAATEDEVTFEIERDRALEPVGSSAVYQLLSDASKTTVDAGEGSRRKRRNQVIHHVGAVGGRAYFCAGEPEKARLYVRTLQLQTVWKELQARARIDDLATCSLPSVAYGRALLLSEELAEVAPAASELAGSDLREDLRRPALEVQDAVAGLQSDVKEYISQHEIDPWWPDEVEKTVVGFTPQRLLEIVEPVYPAAREVDDAHDLVPLLEDRIRRVRNPEHTRRYDEDPERAAQYLFERTSALTYVARRWGGTEAKLQGMMASSQLGCLRDVRFVLPALEDENPDRRLAGVACAALLSSDRALPHLERLAENDPASGVRDSAGWALRFAQAEDGDLPELLRETAQV